MNVNGLNTKFELNASIQVPVQRSFNSSVPKIIPEPLEQDIEGPSPSQNEADLKCMSNEPKYFS